MQLEVILTGDWFAFLFLIALPVTVTVKTQNSLQIQTLTTRDCNGPQTNMPKNVGSVKT